jgi:hypothetical protein
MCSSEKELLEFIAGGDRDILNKEGRRSCWV